MEGTRQTTYLRQWREFREISLVKAGAEIGVSHGHLSKIERGIRQYNQDQLEGLASLYGTDTVSLLSRDPRDPRARAQDQAMDMIRKMPADLADRALEMLKLLR